MIEVLSGIKFLWAPIAGVVALIAWFVRLEATSLDNRRRILKLENDTADNQKELKKDLQRIEDTIKENNRTTNETLQKIIFALGKTNDGSS